MTHESCLERHLAISDLSMKIQANLAFRPNLRPFFPFVILVSLDLQYMVMPTTISQDMVLVSSGSFCLVVVILH